MKIYGFESYGGPEVQGFLDVPTPEPLPDTVLVELTAVGVNPADIKVRNGDRRAQFPVIFPMAMGREGAGVVVSDPSMTFQPGDEVFGSGAAGYGLLGQFALFGREQTSRVPAGVSAEQAACIPIAIGTAWDALGELALPPNAVLLVLGAGGGVGSHAIQLAKHLGLRVIGVASESKAGLVGELGAEHVASGDGWAERVRELAGGPVGGVIDAVGGDVLREAAGLVRNPAKIRSAADPTLADELGGSGVTRRRTARVYGELAALVAEGQLRPIIGARFDFELSSDAVAHVESGHAEGRTVVSF